MKDYNLVKIIKEGKMKVYKIYANCRVYFKVYVNAKNKKEAIKKYENGDYFGYDEFDADNYTLESIEEDK